MCAIRATLYARRYTHDTKSQAIVFVLFIMAVFGILSATLGVMWETEIRTRASDRDGLIAFYLAQAGIERAKITLAANEAWTGGGPFTFSPGQTYTISANDIACPPGPYDTCKQITSIGTITAGALVVAERNITIQASLDNPPLDPPNTPGDEQPIPWSWREQ